MATLSRLKPGQAVYSVESQRMGNTTMRGQAIFRVVIKEVVADGVIASWNGNPARMFGLNAVKRWKVNKPERKPNIFERARLARKEGIA